MDQRQSPPKNDSPSFDRQSVSFKFTKQTPKTLFGNKLDESDIQAEKDYVISVAKDEIKSSAPRYREKDLVIPLIRKNNWRVSDKESNDAEDPDRKIKEMAIKELLQETAEKNEEWENRDSQSITVAIPLIMQNKVPEGFETDEKMDVSLRPDESTLDDYERVPIDKYGLAVLRGMGWKEGDPIGANSKNCVEPVKVHVRPKGLGLGADTSALKKLQDKKSKDEKLLLVKGAYVHIIQGSHKGHYGQVLGLDEENARAIVKLSNDETVTFPEFYVDVVSKNIYDKESKVIMQLYLFSADFILYKHSFLHFILNLLHTKNRKAYQKYKEETEKKEDSLKHQLDKRDKETEEDSVPDEKYVREEKKGSRESLSRSKDSSSDKRCKKRKHSRERSLETFSRDGREKSWIRPQLKVRLIDDRYKNGRYFNTKLIIVDVLSPLNCTCKTEDNKYLDDISPSMLETVIPRSDPSYVMIVQGKHSGELCTILKRDKSKCIATVQFLSDRDQALKIEYDFICEYVGDVSQFD